jgi:hypothetical protein
MSSSVVVAVTFSVQAAVPETEEKFTTAASDRRLLRILSPK